MEQLGLFGQVTKAGEKKEAVGPPAWRPRPPRGQLALTGELQAVTRSILQEQKASFRKACEAVKADS